MNSGTLKIPEKLLFTLIAAVFIFLGAMAIANEVHTGSTKYSGIVTLVGPDAVSFGRICILLGALPLVVWLPRRFVLAVSCIWGVALLALIFVPLYLR
jgi:hypothetical protein